jgi:hypothetical protein
LQPIKKFKNYFLFEAKNYHPKDSWRASFFTLILVALGSQAYAPAPPSLPWSLTATN